MKKKIASRKKVVKGKIIGNAKKELIQVANAFKVIHGILSKEKTIENFLEARKLTDVLGNIVGKIATKYNLENKETEIFVGTIVFGKETVKRVKELLNY